MIVSYSLVAPDGTILYTGTYERCVHIRKLNPNTSIIANHEQDT
jgi:hypothetical protein